jgi:ATP-binding cassette subfamily F protein 3
MGERSEYSQGAGYLLKYGRKITMLQIKNLHYSIAGRPLLQGVDWSIPAGKRAALVGPNGAGKTTLLRCVTGEVHPDRGDIIMPKNYRIGYLPQEEIELPEADLLQSVLEGDREAAELEKKIESLRHEISDSVENNPKLLKQLGDLEHRFVSLGGYHREIDAKTILSGLGFQENDWNRPLSEFSGGWRMRSYLARLLLRKPDLLLLDEPTNHLDLPSLEWLEDFLLEYDGGMIIVSHDRFFIDRLAQSIYELERGTITGYPGNYHFFLEKKEQNRQLLWKKWEEQQEEIKRQQRFIERFRYKATKAAQVQSRIKQLEKMERIEPPPKPPTWEFSLHPSVKSYKDVLQIENMSFRYDGGWILHNINLHISRGEKAALVGVNGAGKTTLTRLITGQLQPKEGKLELGQRTRIGYFAQHRLSELNPDNTIYEEVEAAVSEDYLPRVRHALGLFQFSGDDVEKKIGVLSGGEKARVSLVKILLSPVNFLVMDEPTNHLDLISREALEGALKEYSGTLLVISHDRYFLDKLVNRVVEIKAGHLEEYSGNYSYYLRKRRTADREEPSREDTGSIAPSDKQQEKDRKRREAEARQRISKDRSRLQKRIQELESGIEEREHRKKDIEQQLCQPEVLNDSTRVVELQKELAALTKELKSLYSDWEHEQAELEKLLASCPGV